MTSEILLLSLRGAMLRVGPSAFTEQEQQMIRSPVVELARR
jgi:hypothetical protein